MEFVDSRDQKTASPKRIEIYSGIFSFLLLAGLLSFIFVPGISLYTISTDFRWRKSLINLYEAYRFRVGDRIFNNAVVGREGWIFYTGELSIQDYQNTAPIKEKTLARLQKGLNRLNKDLRERGITLLVVIPPNKSTVYSQYMPNEIPVLGETSRLEQFVEMMNAQDEVQVIDLSQVLQNASQSHQVYFKTDTHWNDMGAYYGYLEIMNALSKEYPTLQPHPLADFEYTATGTFSRDLPLLMGLSSYKEERWELIPKFDVNLEVTRAAVPDGIHYIRTVTNDNTELPGLLVFSDSFYGALARFLEPHFSTVKDIPLNGDSEIWSLDWIEKENPDIVIIESVERYLGIGLPDLIETGPISP